jgi:hypothetical protein
LVAVIAPVAFEPAVATEPVQPSDAVQAVALVDDQVNVELSPFATLVGLALKETLGALAETVTVAVCDAAPPAPVHVSVNFVVAERVEVAVEPLGAWLPLQPPDAMQAAALVDDQCNADEVPLLTVLGVAARVTAGAVWVTETVADCVALPPAPVQVSP